MHKVLVPGAGSAPAGLPVLWPLILTISIAALAVLPVAVCIAALIWAVAGLVGIPAPIVLGLDGLAIAAVAVLSLPMLVRVFRQERHDAGEAQTMRKSSPRK